MDETAPTEETGLFLARDRAMRDVRPNDWWYDRFDDGTHEGLLIWTRCLNFQLYENTETGEEVVILTGQTLDGNLAVVEGFADSTVLALSDRDAARCGMIDWLLTVIAQRKMDAYMAAGGRN